MGPRGTLGFGLAIGGLALILWPQGGADVDSGRRLLGDVIFLVNGFTWACYNVMGKQMMARHDPLPVIAAAGMVGFVGLLPFAAGEWRAAARRSSRSSASARWPILGYW